VLNQIASKVPGWSGRWDLLWDNIQLRASILNTIVDVANKTNNKNLLEAETSVRANQMFHILCEKSREETGSIDSKSVYEKWLEWFRNHAKRWHDV
jgi:hypothetical protein